MKKILFTILTGLSLLAMTSAANASASCTLSITGPSDSRYTYKVTFTVYDLWTTPWSVVGGPSTPAQCYLGMNYLTIPYDVIPDCTDRWYAIATVYQYYNGIPTGNILSSPKGPLDSGEYYTQAYLNFSVAF